jgi:hypothetical protein
VVSPPVCATGLSLIVIGCLIGTTPRSQPWTAAVTLPQGRNGLNARRMVVLFTFREPSLCRHVHRELMRSALLDLTHIIPAITCNQRNYVSDTAHRSLILEACLKIWKFSLQRENDVEV